MDSRSLPVKEVDFIPLRLSSDGASPKRVDLLSVKDGSFDASQNALASGSGVIDDKRSIRHTFWNIVSYKFRSQMCASSFSFMFVFGTCSAEFV